MGNGNDKKGDSGSAGSNGRRFTSSAGERRGPPRRDDRRGPSRGRPDSGATGRAGAEAAILATLRELEKPLTNGDFEAQKPHLAALATRLRPLRLPSIDALEFDARTRLFTALLRAGRQGPVADADKDAHRKEVLGLVGDVWHALADERRAALLYAAAGRTEPAMRILRSAGEWQDAAELLRKEGKPLEAARLYEQHHQPDKAREAYLEAAELLKREGKPAEAARLLEAHGAAREAIDLFREAGDVRGWLRSALAAGEAEQAREAARRLPPRAARALLLRQGAGDLYLDLLAGRGEWGEIARLYSRSGQWADAAQAWEKANRLLRAAECWKNAGDPAAAERCLSAEVEARKERGDLVGAGEALRRFGEHRRAVDLIRDARPDLAFKWLQQAGLDAEAVALAQLEARRKDAAGEKAQAAGWLERAGELPAAAEVYLAAGLFAEAQRVYETLGAWEQAGEAAARAGNVESAVALFRRARVEEPEQRAAALAPAKPEPASPGEETRSEPE